MWVFVDHPRAMGETYWQHFWAAVRIAGLMATGACAALVHAVVPALFPRTASGCARRVVASVDFRAVHK
jgi:hypothetical protein